MTKKSIPLPDSEKVLEKAEGLAVWIHQNVDPSSLTIEFEMGEMNVSMYLDTSAARKLARAIYKHAKYSEDRPPSVPTLEGGQQDDSSTT